MPDFSDTTPMPFDLAPVPPPNLRVVPSPPVAAVELRAASLSSAIEVPPMFAVAERAEPPDVVSPRQRVAGTMPLGIRLPAIRSPRPNEGAAPASAAAPPPALPAPAAYREPPRVPAARADTSHEPPPAARAAGSIAAAAATAAAIAADAHARVASPAPVAAAAPARVASPAPAAAAGQARVGRPPPAPPAPPPPAQAQHHRGNLFRREVLAARRGVASPDEEVKLPRPSAYGWGIVLVIASLTLFIFGGAAIAKVEVTVVAPGALRDPKGLRAVAATLSGAIAEVLVRAGDEVREGQVLARLEVAQLEANLKLREQELAVLDKENAVAERADAQYSAQMARALRQRRAVLSRRAGLNRALKGQRKDQLERMTKSVREGVASLNQELVTREALQQALEAEQLLRSGITDIDVQLAEIADRMENRALARRTEQARLVAAVAAARALIEQATIVAPAAGRVESLLVSPGSVVAAGQLLAQIVPGGVLRSIVAFLPARETAFVSVGSLARVEVESLPVSEFGQAQARVTRISTDIAKPEELVAQFGEGAPGSFVRVELELLPGSETEQMAPHLRSGELLKVRLHRRERRIISLMFQFARTWLGQ